MRGFLCVCGLIGGFEGLVHTLSATLIAIADEDNGLALERFESCVFLVEDSSGHACE